MIDFGMHTNMADDRSLNHDGSVLEFSRRMGTTIQACHHSNTACLKAPLLTVLNIKH